MTTPVPAAAVPRRQRSRASRAFSLIELMVVVGLIAALVAIAGVALSGRGGDGVALSNAQVVLSGLVSATRAQAALHQTSARLLVYAQLPSNGDAAKYLRYLQVVREDPVGSNFWVAAGNPVTLPAPICVVPPTPVPATHLNTGVTWNNNAATGPVSVFSTTILTNFQIAGQSNVVNGVQRATRQIFGGTGGGRAYYLEFDSTGAVTSNSTVNPTKIALTTAVLNASAVPRFNNASAVRGLFVRKSGAISLVDNADAF